MSDLNILFLLLVLAPQAVVGAQVTVLAPPAAHPLVQDHHPAHLVHQTLLVHHDPVALTRSAQRRGNQTLL